MTMPGTLFAGLEVASDSFSKLFKLHKLNVTDPNDSAQQLSHIQVLWYLELLAQGNEMLTFHYVSRNPLANGVCGLLERRRTRYKRVEETLGLLKSSRKLKNYPHSEFLLHVMPVLFTHFRI
jgi:hypothetical protein